MYPTNRFLFSPPPPLLVPFSRNYYNYRFQPTTNQDIEILVLVKSNKSKLCVLLCTIPCLPFVWAELDLYLQLTERRGDGLMDRLVEGTSRKSKTLTHVKGGKGGGGDCQCLNLTKIVNSDT